MSRIFEIPLADIEHEEIDMPLMDIESKENRPDESFEVITVEKIKAMLGKDLKLVNISEKEDFFILEPKDIGLSEWWQIREKILSLNPVFHGSRFKIRKGRFIIEKRKLS